jgi:hypothetical protein
MNRFLIKIVQLLLFTLLILSVIGFYKQQDHIISAKRSLFEINKKQINGLIIGTSHSYWGINPTLFPFKAINIAEINKPIEVDIEIIEKNIDQFPVLKYVFIPIDYFTFYYTGSKEPYSARYYHHWGLKNGYINSYCLKKFHVFTCGFSLIESDISKEQDPLLGYLPKYDALSALSETEKMNNCEKRISTWNEHWIDTNNTSYLCKRITDLGVLLKKRRIQPIFINMPVSKMFYTYYDAKIILRNEELLNQIINTTQAKYINLQSNPAFTSDSLFCDIDHLNDKGATIATNLIREFVRNTN